MKATENKERQSSLIHQKIRNASFVPLESQNTEIFKYNIWLKVNRYINNKFIALKTSYNKVIQKPQLWLDKVDLKAVRNDVFTWLIEALIEGFVINFTVWALIGWRFNFMTMSAWGFAIKELLSIYWRLRRDGADSTISKKNK